MFAARIVHFILSGIMLSHFSAYLSTSRYASDPRSTKLLLWTVFLLDAANVALHFEGTYHCESLRAGLGGHGDTSGVGCPLWKGGG